LPTDYPHPNSPVTVEAACAIRESMARYAAHLAAELDKAREENEKAKRMLFDADNHASRLTAELAELRERERRIGAVMARFDEALGDTDPDEIDEYETPFHWCFREIMAALPTPPAVEADGEEGGTE
jgi:hypothetical protein